MIHEFTYISVLVKIEVSSTNKSHFIINSNRAHIGQATFTQDISICCTTKTPAKLITMISRFALLTHSQSKFSHLTMTSHTVHLSNSQCDQCYGLSETQLPPIVTLSSNFHVSLAISDLWFFSLTGCFPLNFYLSSNHFQLVSYWTSNVYTMSKYLSYHHISISSNYILYQKNSQNDWVKFSNFLTFSHLSWWYSMELSYLWYIRYKEHTIRQNNLEITLHMFPGQSR